MIVNIRRYFLFGFALLYFLTLLVPTFKSLPLTLGDASYIVPWVIAMIMFKPDIVTSKEFKVCFVFLVIHIVYLAINNYALLNPRTTYTLADVFISLFFAMSFWAYFRLEKDITRMRTLSKIILAFIILTSVTTFIGLLMFPTAVRDLIGNDNEAEVTFYLRLNIGSYFFQYLLVFITPLFLYFYKLHKKKIWLVLFLFLVVEVVYAQIVAATLLLLFNVVLTVFLLARKQTITRYLNSIFLIFAFFIIGKGILAQIFYYLASVSTGFEAMTEKLEEVAVYFDSGGEVDTSSVNAYAYHIRYVESEQAFFASPFLGGTGPSGGHHFWIDNLAEHGIIGTIGWLFVFIVFFKTTKNFFSTNERILVLNSLLIFFLIGLNKNILINNMPIIIFFIFPIILYFFGENSKRTHQV